MENTNLQSVVQRVLWLTETQDNPPVLSPEDLRSMVKTASWCLENGFTDTETVKYCRCCEEVNPTLEEDRALARMRALTEAVVARTGRNLSKGGVWPNDDAIDQLVLFLERDKGEPA